MVCPSNPAAELISRGQTPSGGPVRESLGALSAGAGAQIAPDEPQGQSTGRDIADCASGGAPSSDQECSECVGELRDGRDLPQPQRNFICQQSATLGEHPALAVQLDQTGQFVTVER